MTIIALCAYILGFKFILTEVPDYHILQYL